MARYGSDSSPERHQTAPPACGTRACGSDERDVGEELAERLTAAAQPAARSAFAAELIGCAVDVPDAFAARLRSVADASSRGRHATAAAEFDQGRGTTIRSVP